MKIQDWFMRNCRFAQSQQYFDFYNPAEYKPAMPVYEQQDEAFWNWVRTEANSLALPEAIESVMMDYPMYLDTYLQSQQIPHQVVQFPTGKTEETVELKGKKYILDRVATRIEEAEQWLAMLDTWNLDEYFPEKDFNQEFWDGVGPGYKRYHATQPENLEGIMREGLNPASDTRAMSNRNMADAVFTASDPALISAYGEAVLVIDVGAMKAAGYMPAVSQEEPFADEERKSAMARKLGIEDWVGGEYGSEGLDEDTVAFSQNIPPQFLSLYKGE